jgi:hypothetical protein
MAAVEFRQRCAAYRRHYEEIAKEMSTGEMDKVALNAAGT